jgi:hypothetical protein
MFFKKRLKISPIFFFQKYWPKPQKTKQKLKGIRWYIITHYIVPFFLEKKKIFFSIKKIEVNGPQFKKNVICLFQLKMIKKRYQPIVVVKENKNKQIRNSMEELYSFSKIEH